MKIRKWIKLSNFWFKSGMVFSILLTTLINLFIKVAAGRPGGEVFWLVWLIFGWAILYSFAAVGLGAGLSIPLGILILTLGVFINIVYLFIVWTLLSIIYKKSKFLLLAILLFMFLWVGHDIYRRYLNYSKSEGIISERLYVKGEYYYNISIEKGDPSICEKIQHQRWRDSCYARNAFLKNDPALCERINNEGEKNQCLYLYITSNKNEPKICEKIINQDFKYMCYFWTTAEENRLGLCDKIQNQSVKDNCYENTSRMRPEPEICEKIQGKSLRDSCYKNIIFSNRDSSICERINNQDWKYMCYSQCEVKTDALEHCDKIQNQDLKDHCYYSVAFKKRDLSICDRIQGRIKGICKSQLSGLEMKHQDIEDKHKKAAEADTF